jgi:cytochrome c oxidase subunit 2
MRSRFVAAITLLFAASAISGCASSPTFLNPSSTVSAHEARLYGVIFYMALGVFIFVEGWLIYNIIRFRSRGDDSEPPQKYGNTRLEQTWTIIPILLVGLLFFFTVTTIRAVAAPTTGKQVRVNVTGHRWWWEFSYPDGKVVTANELHVPVNTPIVMDVTSVDVIHSFWVPQLSGKIDAIPGQTNHLWFQADKVGTFHGQCAEFCGQNHANMRFTVVVQSQADYDAWVKGQQAPLVQPQNAQQQQAFNLITNGICKNCHMLGENKPINNIGPNLTHLMSRSVFAGAILDMNETNLRAWLEDNQHLKPGNDMNIKLTPAEVDELVSYLSQLK